MFLISHNPTISLWTKLYILANLMSGINYLSDH